MSSAPDRRTVASAVLAFTIAGLIAVLLIAVLVTVVVRRQATDQAVDEARRLTSVQGRAVVEPALTDGLFGGDPAAVAHLDSIVRERLLSEDLVRVKLWSADGRILYSDEPRLIGARYASSDEEEESDLAAGDAEADLSDLDRPENRYERQYGKLLEVYMDLEGPSGQKVEYESYFRFSAVSGSGRRLFLSIAPALIGGLGLLYLIQVPLAWSMARRLSQGQRERERLLRRAIEASEVERRRIAADLHDGVVQGLAGASYSLAAAGDRAERAGAGDVAATVRKAGSDLRQWLRELRTLVVSIAPPKLHDEGLAAALSDLTSPLATRGISADVEFDETVHLDPEIEVLVFRAAQEALRNVTAHADASHVALRVCRENGRVLLEVRDDGRGFDAAGREERARGGHVGLALLEALAEEAGGELRVTSVPDEGTQVVLDVPAP